MKEAYDNKSAIMSMLFQNKFHVEEYFDQWEVKDEEIYLDSANIFDPGNGKDE